MSDRTCKIQDCGGRVYSRGNCNKHYQYNKKHHPELLDPVVSRKMACSVDGCTSMASAKRLCPMHYARVKNHGDPHYVRPAPEEKPCSAEECSRVAQVASMCTMHYQRWAKTGTTDLRTGAPRRLCDIDGCGRPHKAKGYCSKHYHAYRYHGDPLVDTGYRRYDTPQESFASRTEWQGDCLVWTGWVADTGYGYISRGEGREQLVHRWAWEQEHGPIPEGMEIDHRCHNRACCNTKHLRIATTKQNRENQQGAYKNNKSSGIRGVSWDKSRSTWVAYIGHHGKTRNLGRYDTVEEAAEAAKQARLKYFTYNDADRRSTWEGS